MLRTYMNTRTHAQHMVNVTCTISLDRRDENHITLKVV